MGLDGVKGRVWDYLTGVGMEMKGVGGYNGSLLNATLQTG